MNSDGSLSCTTPKDKLYSSEHMVDNIHFLLPKTYKDVELTDFAIYLKYVNPAKLAKIEPLVLYNKNYKDTYLEYMLPITSEFTKFPGIVTLHLTMMDVNEQTDIKYVAQSGEIDIPILVVNDYFVNELSLSAIDKRLVTMEEIAAQYDKSKADNIVREENSIYLTSNGNKIGDTVSIDQDELNVVEFETIEGSDEDSSGFDVVEF